MTDAKQPTAAQYQALLSAFAKQERTMKEVAAELRVGHGHVPSDAELWLRGLADELDTREAKADADR
jgi:hypothetical protein